MRLKRIVEKAQTLRSLKIFLSVFEASKALNAKQCVFALNLTL